jgi:solute:Na+ symporter, SSS family
MEAVVWTDVVQGFVLIGGALLCITIAIFGIDGGPVHFFEVAFNEQKFSWGDIDWDYTTASMWVVVVGNIFYRLSTFSSDQSIVQRYMSTADEKQAKRASWTSLLSLIPWSVIVFGLGTALFVFYKEHPAALNPTIDTDGIVPLFIAQNVPVGVSGLIIAGIFAAAMSSLDSAMHSTATVVVTDFYHRFFPGSTEAFRLKLAKWLIAIFGIFGTGISLLMVTQNIVSIWDVFIAFTGLFGGITAGLFLLGIFTTKANSTGAMMGVVGSSILLYFVKVATDIHLLLFGAIGLIGCMLIGYLASWILPGKAQTEGLTIYSVKNKNNKVGNVVNV